MRRSLRLLLLAAAMPLIGAETPGALPPVAPICHAASDPEALGPAGAILDGYGDGGFVIATKSLEAQAYFNNGMQLAHAFAHAASVSAFKRAEQLDPTCAMCVWGEAWARGPTINFGINKAEQQALAELADKAAVLGAANPAAERTLISALQRRYHDGGGSGRGDVAFARAMDTALKSDDHNLELAVIAADTWLIPAANGADRGHLDRSMAILEAALAQAPSNTGAIHFYIHATEMSGVGVKALPYAETLQALAPAASHLVHMPSHTYFWAGRYRLAEQANLDAVKIDAANALRLKPKDGVFGLPYHGHNLQFAEGASLMDGDGVGGLPLAATEVARAAALDALKPYEQLALGTAYTVYGRFASQDAVAALPEPPHALPYARAPRRYARGEAAARRNDAAAVRQEAAATVITAADLKALVEIARLVLTGRAAMIDKNYPAAETAFGRASDLQDDKLGDLSDPPIWWYPIRRSLAAAFVADGKRPAAQAQLAKVLWRWPYDPVSLRLSAEVAAADGKPEEALRQNALAARNWFGDVAALPKSLL